MQHPPPARNDPCPCGSGRKYKRCCMEREQTLRGIDRPLRLVDGTPSSAPRIFDPALRSELSDEWELDAIPFPASFSDDPAARPVAALVASGPLVVHARVMNRAPAEPEALARVLAQEAQVAIAAAGLVPSRIDVRHADVAAALRPLLHPRGIDVRAVARLTTLNDAARGLVAHLTGREGAPMASFPETWAGWDLPRDAIAQLFRAAAAYYRARPWQRVADDGPIVAALPNGEASYAIVLGNAGQEFGLALHSDPEDVANLYSENDPQRAMHALSGTMISITFAAKHDVPPRMRREVQGAGWELAGPAAYPLLMVMGTPGGGVRQGQIEQLVALLESVPRFVAAAYPDDSRGEPVKLWTDEASGATLSFARVDMSLPETLWDVPDRLAPCGPVGRGALPKATLRTASDEDREEIVRRTVERFTEHCQTEGSFAAVSAKAAKKHASAAWLFVQFLTGYQGIPPSAVTEFDLREFLYNWYPRKVMASEQEARAVCGSLRRFFAFLSEVEGIECPWADTILRDRDAFIDVWYSSRGLGPEGRNADWLAPVTADLEFRALLPANDAEAIEWGGFMGEKEATLYDEMQRLWLRWRDEIIRDGTTDREAVRAELRERQRTWARTPNASVGGETPRRAVKHERERTKRRLSET